MEKKILAAIASVSARGGYGHMGAADAGAVHAMLKSLDQGAFVRMVKALAERKLVDIDEESGYLTLTDAGSARVAADDLPPPEPVAFVAKVPETAPLSAKGKPEPTEPVEVQKVSESAGQVREVTAKSGGAPITNVTKSVAAARENDPSLDPVPATTPRTPTDAPLLDLLPTAGAPAVDVKQAPRGKAAAKAKKPAGKKR